MSYRINKVWIDGESVYASTEEGLLASYPFVMWPRLAKATVEQRQDFYLSYSGIHWPQIDEDLSFEGMFSNAGLCERSEAEDSVYYPGSYIERSEGDKIYCVAED